MDLNSDSESEASVEVEVPEASLELHEGANEDEGEEEDESEEGVGKTEAAEAARRQAEAEGLTLQLSGNKTGYRGVYKDERKANFHASVWRAGEKVYLGCCFSTAEEAALAYARTPEAQVEAAHPKPAPLTAEEAVAQAAAEGLKLEPSDRCASKGSEGGRFPIPCDARRQGCAPRLLLHSRGGSPCRRASSRVH